MKLKRPLQLWLALIMLWLQATAARAEWIPGFEMESSTGGAPLIVIGQFDSTGTLTVTETLRAHKDATALIAVENGATLYRLFKQAMAPETPADPIEVVAFLREKAKESWQPVMGRGGIVGLSTDTVFFFDEKAPPLPEQRIHSTRLVKQPRYTRATFVEAVRQTMEIDDERKRLIALPASPARMQQLLQFLQRHVRIDITDESRNADYHKRWIGGYYHLHHIARNVKPVGAGEENFLIQKLQGTTDIREQLLLLRLAQLIPLSDAAFNTVSGFTQRQRPPLIRREAMSTLSTINGYRAAQYLTQLLSPNEPELAAAIQGVSGGADLRKPGLFAGNVVEPLIALATLKQRDRNKGGHPVNYATEALLGQFENYGHPNMLPVLYSWAMDAEAVYADRALRHLQALTGIKAPREDAATWSAWWQKARSILEQDFELGTTKGLRTWLSSYAQADAPTRAILLRAWLYEPEVVAGELVRIAGDEGERASGQADAAKNALAYLWQHKRLAAQWRKAIVLRFVKLELVQVPPCCPGSMAVQIVATRDFPFPRDTWMNHGSRRVKDDTFPLLEEKDIQSSGSFEGDGPKVLGNFSGGIGKAGEQLGAVLAMKEKDYINFGVELWTHQWKIEPIILRDVPPM